MSELRDIQIKKMIDKDTFANYLGAKIEIVKPGHSRASLTVNENMLNFQGKTHGGVIFTLGDIAFAAASNSHGQVAVGLNVAINYLNASEEGDLLVAEAIEKNTSGPMALYDIEIKNEKTGQLIATSHDLVYRKKEWFVPQA